MDSAPAGGTPPAPPPPAVRSGLQRWRQFLTRPATQRWLALTLVVAITIAILMSHEKLGQLGSYGYPGLFLISLIGNATIVLPAPSLALVFAIGASFSPPLVGLAAGSGETLGELTGYLAGFSGRGIIENGEQYRRIERWMKRYGLWVIFVLSAVPNPFFDIAGMAAGVMKIPVGRFLLAAFPGKFIKTMAAAYLGAHAITLIDLIQSLFRPR